ncbi:serine hydrolase domain-containing protein [Paenibacillus tengchongensis]|uniref:serine hydrolase domain-containing protein n=1 Tax=Paenibacillus tengchongensis TaxID=2608684 RepID=UPI00124E1119|nr:serine hydrolase domain-containing protein [Paenibacillus tengchongensis]
MFNELTPGIGVLANHKGKVVYQDMLGLANCEHEIPIGPDTVFKLTSVSKQFTGMAILQLMERGELRADDRLTKFVPELRHYADEVTVYQLAHHSAGLTDYNDLLWQKARQHALHSDNAEVLGLLSKQDRLRFTPGSRFEYSNSNYVMLAIIIERITWLSLREYLKQHIFGVTGMDDSTVFNEEQPVVPRRAYGYELSGGLWKCHYADTLATGTTNVLSSLRDMQKWDDALYGEQLLGRKTSSTLFAPGLDSSGHPLSEFWGGYSYGWMLQERCDAQTLWHTGGDAGFRSIIVRFYEQEFSVILLCNASCLEWPQTYAYIEQLYKEFH